MNSLTLVASVYGCGVSSLAFEYSYMRIDVQYPGFKDTVFVRLGLVAATRH